MLRFRDQKGRLINPEPQPAIIEFVDAVGKVALVLIPKAGGSVTIITENDTEEASKYAKYMDVQFTSSLIKL